MEAWTPLKVLEWTTRRFGEAGVEPARLEAQILIGHALGLSRMDLYTQFDKPLSQGELAAARALIKRRLAGEPIAYLTGEQEFWSLAFAVDRRVLIPRRDTETLIEVVLAALPDRAAALAVLDVGTGPGTIALTLARELPTARVVATDVSGEALAVARGNAERLGVAGRVELREGSLLAPLRADERFAALAANLPYVRTAELAGLARELHAEPRLALDGGEGGLDLIGALVASAPDHLEPGGVIALEHGLDQGQEVCALLAASARFGAAVTVADLGGRPRVTWARRASP